MTHKVIKVSRYDDDDDGGFETVVPHSATNASKASIASRSVPATVEAAPATPGDALDDAPASGGAVQKKRKIRQRSLKARAVGFLSRREHSRQELARKLAPHVEATDNLESTLDGLEREGWLSTERYAASLVHRRATTRGTLRIVMELRQNGVDDTQIAELKSKLHATETDRAAEVWQKKFKGERPTDAAQFAKQARFLASRGFSSDVVRKVVGGQIDEFE